jgi:sterol 3beta-glucosyltransferase
MNITILSTGTRGDTQPYIALGLALEEAGHRVRLAAFRDFEALITAHGLGFHPVEGDITLVATSDEAKGARKADNPLKFALSMKKFSGRVMRMQKDFFAACEGADAVVYHPGAAIGYFAAQKMGVPSILAIPFPMYPTREYPSLLFYGRAGLGGAFNLMTHKMLEKVIWGASKKVVHDFWMEKYGSLPENFGCPFERQTTKRLPTVICCSTHVFPRPRDWPENVTSTGYWFLDEEKGWTPPKDLLTFINGGETPVYAGFGSIGDPATAEETLQLLISGIRQSGRRGVIATGWSGMAAKGNIPDDIFILEGAPHSWLLPRMAAAVHHGGAGTTAAGLRAGIPNIIIPHGMDQHAWGARVHELGAGPVPIPRKRLTAEKLAHAIRQALTSGIQTSAEELGKKIRSEDGAREAARIISEALKEK